MPAGRSRYSTVAIGLHWLTALIVLGNLVAGLLVGDMLDSGDPAQAALGGNVIMLHRSFGLTVLALTLFRIGWRIANPPPPLPAHMTRLEIIVARASHHGFYLLLLALPLSGWAMSSARLPLRPMSWFGIAEIPPLPLAPAFGSVFRQGHGVLGWLAIAMIALHVLAAVKHHVFDRDDLLARMLPPRRD
ncbi:hypothetical protein GCM10011529_18450 [Polymorphobacter glacialis]|uniref:Cytochrome b561 bacterial/Ni-hydrogenase domain-containing protein n=1 Tax=Sandarakinorhabdus glacialis TaxID=1614636 RepID=A0A917E9G2_9SPHN|nr:cytochrome b [Polymorphobacter glacialis]GGE12400.1 hypothetical protein GCM10011529_18450 [Polymorphobacter glacialis]